MRVPEKVRERRLEADVKRKSKFVDFAHLKMGKKLRMD